MNRSLPGFKLNKAIQGFLQYKAAEALSPRTLESYASHLKKWAEHTGDVELAYVTTQDLRAYIAWLRAEYGPHRFSGDDHPSRRKPSGMFGSRSRRCSPGRRPSWKCPIR